MIFRSDSVRPERKFISRRNSNETLPYTLKFSYVPMRISESR
ncbi:hypothetical protein LEP1GSC052_2639 [Leptospira kmetyi serovar Malaysia str. Bejo-Iso9]|nr:hypothetical protein LEP1GSC052_2639 [Leptospira kmetyi serovar Malaysia str. Bejo-Iso9]